MPVKPKPALPAAASCFGIVYVLLLGWCVAYGLYASMGWLSIGDPAVFNYIGWRILNGAVPYQDIFEADFPGTYLLHMLFISISGSDVSLRLIDLGFCAVSSWGIIIFAARQSRLYALAGALMFTLLHLSWGAKSMLQRDFMMVPFLLFAAYHLKFWLEKPEQTGRMFIFAALLGCAVWIKPLAIVFALLAVVAIASQRISLRLKAEALVKATCGGLVPAALMAAWLWHLGALQAFFTMQFEFTLGAYVQFVPIAWSVVAIQSMMLTILCVVGLLYFLYRCTSLPRAEKTVLTIGLAYGLLHFYAQDKGLWYHAYPFYGFISLYFALVMPRLSAKPWVQAIAYAAPLVFCLQFLPMSALIHDITLDNEQGFTLAYAQGAKDDADAALKTVPAAIKTSYLAHYPNRAIAFMGFRMWNVGYREHWITPIHHIYSFPLYTGLTSPLMSKIRDELLQRFESVKPLVIIIESDSWPFKEPLVYRYIDTHQPWTAFFASNYRLSKQTDVYRVYARVK